MVKLRMFVLLLIALVMLIGCSKQQLINIKETNNPTAIDILTEDPNVDIFQLQDIVYVNASNIDWVQNNELTVGEKIGVITKRYKNEKTFKNGMATVLQIGTEIYKPVEKIGPVLIVISNGNVTRYLGLIEG